MESRQGATGNDKRDSGPERRRLSRNDSGCETRVRGPAEATERKHRCNRRDDNTAPQDVRVEVVSWLKQEPHRKCCSKDNVNNLEHVEKVDVGALDERPQEPDHDRKDREGYTDCRRKPEWKLRLVEQLPFNDCCNHEQDRSSKDLGAF